MEGFGPRRETDVEKRGMERLGFRRVAVKADERLWVHMDRCGGMKDVGLEEGQL